MKTVLYNIVARATGGATVTEDNRRAAEHAIADTLACMVAGQNDISTRAVRRGLGADGIDGPSALVAGGCTDPSLAAIVNGTAAHALDFDDNFAPGMSHASAVLVPAIFALGQQRSVSGKALVDAYLVGLEAQALVGLGVRPEHYAAGWHGTSTVGAIGATAGCAHIIGLDHEGMVHAMSLAVSSAAGMKGQFGTPAKPFHAGMAARNAVQAALLAEAGLFGRDDILECGQGFGELMGGGAPARWDFPDNSVPHVIRTHGLMPKIHPCCGSTHNAVDMVMALRHEHGFAPDEVDRIVLTVGRANYRNLAYPEPKNAMEARFSMQYCVALALFQDILSLKDFTSEAVMRPHLRALFKRIRMEIMPLEQEKASLRPAHHALVRLKDGREFNMDTAYARGTLREPLSEDARIAKLRDCFESVGRSLSDEMLDIFLDIDGLVTLAPLAALVTAR